MFELEAWSLRSPWRHFPFEVLSAYACLAVLALLTKSMVGEWMILGLCVLVLLKNQISLRIWFKLLSGPFLLTLLSCAFLLLGVDLSHASLQISLQWSELDFALLTLSRCTAMMGLSLCLVLLLPMNQMLMVFRKIGLPKEWLELISMSYSTLFELSLRWKQIRRSQTARLAPMGLIPQIRNLALGGGAVLAHTLIFAKAWQRGLAARASEGELIFLHPEPQIHPRVLLGALLIPTLFYCLFWGLDYLI